MYNTLLRLYTSDKLSEQGLAKAVSNGWITPKQYKEITGDTYTE
ncbi:XkdX family protein [Anaerocolumna sp. MB42-C2]|nr:XkdX family protein [Anaerocolumna sp. MB42-C2]WMJ90614.1 XkdX family protein [Anaerocolumna sp. MB42-C2]